MAVKAAGLPLIPDPVTVALSVSVPTLPSVQLPTVATPLAFVVWLGPVTEPFPAVVANITAVPGFGLLNASLTMTAGGVASA